MKKEEQKNIITKGVNDSEIELISQKDTIEPIQMVPLKQSQVQKKESQKKNQVQDGNMGQEAQCTQQYTQEEFKKDQQRENYDGKVKKFLIQTDQYEPILQQQNTEDCSLEQIIKEREKEMLDRVLNKSEVKKVKLLRDTVYEWHPKGVQEVEQVSKTIKKDKKLATIEFSSNGKFHWNNDKKQGYWFELDEHQLVFELDKKCFRMKYCCERDVWKSQPETEQAEMIPKFDDRMVMKPGGKDSEQEHLEPIDNADTFEPIETKLQSQNPLPRNIFKKMMKCKINYLPSRNIEKDGFVVNYIVKRLFVDFKLILQIWKNVVCTHEPSKSTAEMQFEATVNEVPGVETDPNFISYIYQRGWIYWFSIESNWIEDTTQVFFNKYFLNDGQHDHRGPNTPTKNEHYQKSLCREFNHSLRRGRLHSVHFCKEYKKTELEKNTSGYGPYLDNLEREIIFVYEKNWFEIFEGKMIQRISILDRDIKIDLRNRERLEINDIREDLKFDFKQPPILKVYYKQVNKTNFKQWLYLNLGGKPEVLVVQNQDDQDIETIYVGLYKAIKTEQRDREEDNVEATYKEHLKKLNDSAKFHKNQKTTYQEFLAQNVFYEDDLRGQPAYLITKLDKYRAVQNIFQNLAKSNRLGDKHIEIQEQWELSRGVSVFFCYVGKPYMQIIQPVEDSEGGFGHKLLHFDISPVTQNQICIGSNDTISKEKGHQRQTSYMWEAFSGKYDSEESLHFGCKQYFMDFTGPLKCPKGTVLQKYFINDTDDSFVNDLGETVQQMVKKCDKCKKDINDRPNQQQDMTSILYQRAYYYSCNDCCNTNFHDHCLKQEALGDSPMRVKGNNGINTEFVEKSEEQFSTKNKDQCLLINYHNQAELSTPDIYVLNTSHHKELRGQKAGSDKYPSLQFILEKEEDLVQLVKDRPPSDEPWSDALTMVLPSVIDIRDLNDQLQPIILKTPNDIRFIVLDTRTMEIVTQKNISSVLGYSQSSHQSRLSNSQEQTWANRIEFCQTSEKNITIDQQGNAHTEQRYQIMWFDMENYTKIHEINLVTTNKQEANQAKIQLIGIKFFESQDVESDSVEHYTGGGPQSYNQKTLYEKTKAKRLRIFPYYNEQMCIIGSILRLGNGNQTTNGKCFDNGLTYKLPNDEFMFDQQNLTRSGIREYKAAQNTLITEVQLSRLIQQTYDHFSDHEIFKILHNQLVNVLNTVTFSFEGILSRNEDKFPTNAFSTMGYSHFKPLQIIGGKSLISAKLKKPDLLRQCLYKNLKANHKFKTYNQSALERLQLNEDMKKQLLNQGLLSDPANPNIGLDIQQISLLEQAFELGQFNSAKIIINYMYEQEMDQSRYDLMMRTLPIAIEKECCEFYIEFFSKQIDAIENDKLMGKLNIEIDITSNQLERFCSEDLIVNEIINEEVILDSEKQIFRKMLDMDIEHCKQKQSYEIDHMYIDLRPSIFYQKQQMLTTVSLKERYKISQAEFTNLETAKMMREIFNQTGHEIESTQVLRNIIDHQFEGTTFRYFVYLWAIFVLTYLFPFLIQIFTNRLEAVITCNILCILSQLFFFGLEIIQMRDGAAEYVSQTWNRIEITMFLINIVYFVIRLQNPGESFSPLDKDVSSKNSVYIPMVLLNLILVLFSILRMMFYLRVFPSFGSIVQLMQRCFYDITTFTVFFVMWIICFGLIYLITGLEVDTEDYGEMNRYGRTFIQAYRNSIGDLAPPAHEKWNKLVTPEKDNEGLVNLMILVIWLVWFFNQFIVLIILLNFLIAIISQSYELVMTQEILNKYKHRCEFNRECFIVLKFLNLLNKYNTYIVYSKPESADDQNNSEWLGFVTTIKNFIVKQNGSLTQKFSRVVSTQMQGVKDQIHGLRSDHKKLQAQIEGVSSRVHEDLEKMHQDVNKQMTGQVSKLASSIDDIKAMLRDLKLQKSEPKTGMVGTSRDMDKRAKEKQGQSSWDEASATVGKRNDIAPVTTTDKQ